MTVLPWNLQKQVQYDTRVTFKDLFPRINNSFTHFSSRISSHNLWIPSF